VIKKLLRSILSDGAHGRLRAIYDRARYPTFSVFPGHYHSPYVDTQEALAAIRKARTVQLPISSIEIDVDRMQALWDELRPFRDSSLLSSPAPAKRYSPENEFYTYGDALILECLIRYLSPKSIIEIGCGFSSALMLDIRESHGVPETLTFVDPNMSRLRSLIPDSSSSATNFVEQKVQDLDLGMFGGLSGGDVLVVDSSHVLKTGSDLNTILFDILPRLQPGVWIHFHDIFWPFEYPEHWIVEHRFNWNEVYALRAFLMGNAQYEVRFFNDAFARLRSDVVARDDPRFASTPGAALWIQKRLQRNCQRAGT
jgi:hypothetical protein